MKENNKSKPISILTYRGKKKKKQRKPWILPLTRATIIQSRSLEIIAQLGLIDRYIALGRVIDGATVYGTLGRRLTSTDIQIVDSPFNYTLSIRQPWHEKLMVEILQTLGVKVHRGVQLEDVAEDVAARISTVTLLDQRRNQRINVKAKIVLGADGAHSEVRKIAGIDFPGETVSSLAVNCDVIAETNIPTKETARYIYFPLFHGTTEKKKKTNAIFA